MFDKKLLKQLKKIRKIHNQRVKIEKRIEENLKKVKLTQEETNLLDEATKNFFPNSGRWSSSEFKKDENCILCHLRDDYWLAKEIKDEIELHNSNLNIDLYKVLKYVKKSGNFRFYRNEYELRIVYWQINYMLSPDSKEMINNEVVYDENFISFSQNCDIDFRKAVIDTLLTVGINESVIEEGLIKNANRWLDKMIEQSFINKYDKSSWNSKLLGNNGEIEIPPALPEHKELWMLLRKCQFVEKYEDKIIKYGDIKWIQVLRSLPKKEERAKLYLKVENLNNIRIKEIEEYKQKRHNIESESYKQKTKTKGV